MNSLRDRLLALIAQTGPLTIAQFMTAALHDPEHGYYATRPHLGGEGDFITAPETSQMFGEMIGLWAAQSWLEIGAPAPVELIELGPGRGVMMLDVLRAGKAAPGFAAAALVTLVETSAPMRAAQAQTLAGLGGAISWRESLHEARPGPTIVLANEFLDCMAIRQFVRTATGWREKVVGARDGELAFGLVSDPLSSDDSIPPHLRAGPEGAVAEFAPALPAFVETLAGRLLAAPGRALFLDYGAAATTGGDTLQALSRHASADPLAAPGEADLTAHVDFAELARRAHAAGLSVSGPRAQGAWLKALGVDLRAAALAKARPEQADLIARQLRRLTAPDQMGALFQAICLSSPGLAPPAGFTP